MTRLDEKVARFNLLGREMRLHQLLSYARKFPDLPAELEEARDSGLGRVHECQTPLFLWVGLDLEGSVKIHADVPRGAPTVRGFMAFLMDALSGAAPEDVADLPEDLLDRMGLAEVLGIIRTQGLNAVIRRVKHEVTKVA